MVSDLDAPIPPKRPTPPPKAANPRASLNWRKTGARTRGLECRLLPNSHAFQFVLLAPQSLRDTPAAREVMKWRNAKHSKDSGIKRLCRKSKFARKSSMMSANATWLRSMRRTNQWLQQRMRDGPDGLKVSAMSPLPPLIWEMLEICF